MRGRVAASFWYGRRVSSEARRLVGKLVLFLAGCWVLVLAGSAFQPFDPLRFPLFLIPGCAFVPAAYFAIRLHRDPDSGSVWRQMVIYAIAGVVLMIGSGNALYQMGP
jgi:hypothetical protein